MVTLEAPTPLSLPCLSSIAISESELEAQGLHASRARLTVGGSSVGAKTDAALVKCIVQVSTCT